VFFGSGETTIAPKGGRFTRGGEKKDREAWTKGKGGKDHDQSVLRKKTAGVAGERRAEEGGKKGTTHLI